MMKMMTSALSMLTWRWWRTHLSHSRLSKGYQVQLQIFWAVLESPCLQMRLTEECSSARKLSSALHSPRRMLESFHTPNRRDARIAISDSFQTLNQKRASLMLILTIITFGESRWLRCKVLMSKFNLTLFERIYEEEGNNSDCCIFCMLPFS